MVYHISSLAPATTEISSAAIDEADNAKTTPSATPSDQTVEKARPAGSPGGGRP